MKLLQNASCSWQILQSWAPFLMHEGTAWSSWGIQRPSPSSRCGTTCWTTTRSRRSWWRDPSTTSGRAWCSSANLGNLSTPSTPSVQPCCYLLCSEPRKASPHSPLFSLLLQVNSFYWHLFKPSVNFRASVWICKCYCNIAAFVLMIVCVFAGGSLYEHCDVRCPWSPHPRLGLWPQ